MTLSISELCAVTAVACSAPLDNNATVNDPHHSALVAVLVLRVCNSCSACLSLLNSDYLYNANGHIAHMLHVLQGRTISPTAETRPDLFSNTIEDLSKC